jgi:hypothetical protein
MPLLSALSSRPPAVRGVAVVAGALATTVAVTPAVARDDWGGGDGRQEQSRYRGVVSADRLPLRTSPTRGGQVIRYAHRGETVRIRCKTPGDKVRGNPLWYLLTDGTRAWGAARSIDTIGPAPRWC